jgi:SnoaL-like protein
MSQENVEMVRVLAEGFQRRQHELAFEYYDPEIEWDASNTGELIPDLAGVYRGHDGVRTYWRRWLSAWSDLRFEIEDVVGCWQRCGAADLQPAAVGQAQRHRH